jgi:polyhydroxyalkanoate synthesis regulator phasin
MASFEAKAQLSGLAGEIRSSIESDQFDLGGYTEQRASDLFKSAFAAPLTEPTKMVRFTFVVGGGKLVRAKYNDDLSRWVIAALREVGYSEDRSAAETFDSQGTFKQQHDTGQNLKYIIVYPFVTCANAATTAGGGEGSAVVVDPSSPEYIVCACESATLKDMVASKVVSYKQKKHLLHVLQTSSDNFKDIEAKLMTGAALTPAEQATYDANSGADAEKIAWLQGEIKSMVDQGKLTQAEKTELLQSIDANIAAVSNEIEEATADNKPKKVEKLQAKKDAITARKVAISAVSPITHRLSQGDQIVSLYLKLFPLIALEDKGRSMSLTLADLKTLEPKSDIEEAIRSLENASRGWFLGDEEFQSMCRAIEREATAKYAAKKGAGSGAKKTGGSSSAGSAGASKSSSGWGTVTSKKGSSSSNSSSSVGAKKAAGSSFAAAFGGGDSD